MEPNNNPGNFDLPIEDNFDINRSISLFISNWYWFAIALFISLSIAYGVNRYSEKIFSVSSSLLINDNQYGGGNSAIGNIVPGGDIFRTNQNLINEMGILRSFMLNKKVMEELKEFNVVYIGVGRRRIVETRMYKTCPFKVTYNSIYMQKIGEKVTIELLSDTMFTLKINNGRNFEKTMRVGEWFTEMGYNFVIEPRNPGGKLMDYTTSNHYTFYFTTPESLANEYRSKLYVGPIEKDASLVILSVSGYVTEQEADYLNKLMEIYIEYGRSYKAETATKTMEFIDQQIRIISDSLKKTEDNMAVFRKNNSYFDPTQEGGRIKGRLEEYDNERITYELQMKYYNYLTEYLKNNSNSEAIISPSAIGITDPNIFLYVNELSNVQNEKSKLALNIETSQPAITLMENQAEKARGALMENVREGIEVLKLSIKDLDRKIALVKEELRNLPATEREYIIVQREFDINNTVYTYLLEKRAETGIAKASIVSDNREIDNASQFRASLIKPKIRKNYIMALILGLMVPMAAIVLIDFLNDKVIDKKDVENKTRVPVIGFISHDDSKSGIPVVEKSGSSLAESFRSIRTSLKYFIKDNEKTVIAVSSTISSEGKTFISINLASIIAMLGKKVVIMGLDLRKPGLNKVFEYENSPGLSTYLSGNCIYEDVIKQTQIKNLFYAPSGPIPPNPAELIETGLMKEFIERTRAEFDFIIIDTPPIAIVTDALLLAPYVDVNLYIVRQRYTSRNTLDIIEELYTKGNLKNMAIIVNDINLSGYYGYGMRYKYSLGYRYSYGYNYYGKGYYKLYGQSDKSHGYYTDES